MVQGQKFVVPSENQTTDGLPTMLDNHYTTRSPLNLKKSKYKQDLKKKKTLDHYYYYYYYHGLGNIVPRLNDAVLVSSHYIYHIGKPGNESLFTSEFSKEN